MTKEYVGANIYMTTNEKKGADKNNASLCEPF